MTLHVELVTPEREVWTGDARMVVAKTRDGDLGVLTGHAPVIGLLAEGSLVRILDPGASSGEGTGEVVAAVSSGFLSVADNRVSILAREAQLGSQVDTASVRARLAEGEQPGQGHDPDAKYAEALLRAAGERS